MKFINTAKLIKERDIIKDWLKNQPNHSANYEIIRQLHKVENILRKKKVIQ